MFHSCFKHMKEPLASATNYARPSFTEFSGFYVQTIFFNMVTSRAIKLSLN